MPVALIPTKAKTVKSYHKSSTNTSKNRVLSIFMSPQSRKIYTKITIHHHFLGWIKDQTLVFSIMQILLYTCHRYHMWCLGFICKTVILMNSKGYIWYCVWFQIQNNHCDKSIWVGLISLILSTILICTERCLNIGDHW